MTIICFSCNGSGWGFKYPAGLSKKELFIYVPCPSCKGKGFVEMKNGPERKEEPPKDGGVA